MDRLQLRNTVIWMMLAAMSWLFFNIGPGLWPLLVLALGIRVIARAVERGMGGKRLADLRIRGWVAVLVVLVAIALPVCMVVWQPGGGGDRQPDHRGGARTGSLRAINAIRIGPLGGFRIAFRPGFIDWPEGFVALEEAVTKMSAFLVALPPDQRGEVLRDEVRLEEVCTEMAPQLGSRRGVIHVAMTEDGTELVVRGGFAFAWWPLGEWVVYHGMHIRPDNRAEPFSDDELRPLW